MAVLIGRTCRAAEKKPGISYSPAFFEDARGEFFGVPQAAPNPRVFVLLLLFCFALLLCFLFVLLLFFFLRCYLALSLACTL